MFILLIYALKSHDRESFSILHMFSQMPRVRGGEVISWNKMVSYSRPLNSCDH